MQIKILTATEMHGQDISHDSGIFMHSSRDQRSTLLRKADTANSLATPQLFLIP